MDEKNVSRRNFSRLSLAAAAGMVAASGVAMAQKEKKKDGAAYPVDPALLLQDPNVCRGLNTCKGKGKGDHNCAGLGACATAEAHACNGHNVCKGQGGCGGYPGQNNCKEHGHCAVPLSKESWALARKQYEHLMTDLGQKFSPAPTA